MLKQVTVAAILAMVGGSPALAAEYYVVQERTSKKCKVVETRPSASETTWVQHVACYVAVYPRYPESTLAPA